MFNVRNTGKTLVTRTQGTSTASDGRKGRVFEVSPADVQSDDVAFRKFKLNTEDAQGKDCLTNFHGMGLTRDKMCPTETFSMNQWACGQNVKEKTLDDGRRQAQFKHGAVVQEQEYSKGKAVTGEDRGTEENTFRSLSWSHSDPSSDAGGLVLLLLIPPTAVVPTALGVALCPCSWLHSLRVCWSLAAAVVLRPHAQQRPALPGWEGQDERAPSVGPLPSGVRHTGPHASVCHGTASSLVQLAGTCLPSASLASTETLW
ncbi:40S ribosomal protein S3a [Tupaia chinensis]|uniref:40S ribosomal protein S3a n=1 Tax=Tupaia chinensis TaxID=246437 RepID=L9L7X8_TUPCH|nr:40S ribosomal protein S3a [Tupaia chinensis]